MTPAMTGVRSVTIAADDAEQRLDRWFRRHFPGLTQGRLEKLLRTGQIRVDGARAKAAQRLEAGQTVRIPPLDAAASAPPEARPKPQPADAEAQRWGEALRRAILFMDDSVIVIDKPAGLASQGGGKIRLHVDGLLDALRFDMAERPRLVHRLDQETSGVLLIGRSARATRRLGEAFRARETRKEYWCVTVGVPPRDEGRIDLPLIRAPNNIGRVAEKGEEDARHAVTDFRVVERAGKRAAFLAMWPLTGRTHQLRLHCAAIGAPILGDLKYGGEQATLPGADLPAGLHLHARRLTLPHPVRGTIDVTAPLPAHMVRTFAYFGFDRDAEVPPPP